MTGLRNAENSIYIRTKEYAESMQKSFRPFIKVLLKFCSFFGSDLSEIQAKAKNNEISRSKSGSFQVRRRFSRCEIEQRAACSRGLKEQTERSRQKDTDQDKGKIINEILWLTQNFLR